MNSPKMKTCLPDAWENLYRKSWNKLPWIGSRIPIDPLKQFFELLQPPRRILDFGCGEGRVAQVLDQWGAIVTAVDCAETAIRYGRPLQNGCYHRADKLDDFANMTFDGLVLWGVLHHYPPQDWFSWIASAKKALGSGGILLLGGFDCEDDGFKGNPVRISPTTGANAFGVHHDLVASILKAKDMSVLESCLIELEDGGSDNIRTWRYLLAKR